LDGARAKATPAPKQGADTQSVLRNAGFSDDDIRSLREEKVI
jgi:crotonobetainyl-CoA:carnitine CoA-transferase CaiB-like acyl-CoA transferase